MPLTAPPSCGTRSTIANRPDLLYVAHQSGVGRQASFGRPLSQPAFEQRHLVFRPRTITRHRSVLESRRDGVAMSPHIGNGPQIERGMHRLTTALAKEGPDNRGEGKFSARTWRRRAHDATSSLFRKPVLLSQRVVLVTSISMTTPTTMATSRPPDQPICLEEIDPRLEKGGARDCWRLGKKDRLTLASAPVRAHRESDCAIV